jgi:organic hydroperoxide reductase OsmC/OhrA
MPEKHHNYAVTITWTGNLGPGTTAYSAFSRAHTIEAPEKPTILGSSDPAFRGDKSRWNPEELLLASLSTCHQLWYLHLCAEAGIIVTAYHDHAEGIMHEEANGAGQFTAVTLRPHVTITAASDAAKARDLHHKAHEMCFIARSVNFSVHTEPKIQKE